MSRIQICSFCVFVAVAVHFSADTARAGLIVNYDFEGDVLTPTVSLAGVTAGNFSYSGDGTPTFSSGNGSDDAYLSKRGPRTAFRTTTSPSL